MTPKQPDHPVDVRIYADGACSGNPGPGGWGTILVCDNPAKTLELSGGEADTTNNRMEIMAAIAGLEALRYPCRVVVVTDSRYLHDAFVKKWIEKWIRNGWRRGKKSVVKNRDLWERLLEAVKPHDVSWEWVRGHAGHPENERADALAVAARDAAARG